jgi:MFS superfamily sulfate permease-like transporter
VALINCPDCNHKISDSAAACPGCGAIRRAYNELNWPAFHIAAAALVIAVATPIMSSAMHLWEKLLTICVLAVVVTALAWGIPWLAEQRRLHREHTVTKSKKRKYAPSK